MKTKQERESDKLHRKYQVELKKEQSQLKKDVARELRILKFMLKHDVLYHHHSKESSSKDKIKTQIEYLKTRNGFREYNSYLWNYLGEGKNYMPLSWLGFIFSSTEFASIYEVPLDGSYKFYAHDSGMRGLGSFDYLKAIKVEKQIAVPKVNPGGFPPITC